MQQPELLDWITILRASTTARPSPRRVTALQAPGSVEKWSQLAESQVVVMLDRDGYRPNVAIVIVNSKNFVFWGKRIREHAWQFPQGGMHPGETPSRRCIGS